MSRSFALLALALLLAGCTRYGTNPQGGPFARGKPRPPANPYPGPNAVAANPVPPGPPGGSPLVLPAAATHPLPPPPPDDPRVVPVPGHPPEPAPLAGGFTAPGPVVPAGGIVPAAPAFPPVRPPRSEPQPADLPSPLAPKQPSAMSASDAPPVATSVAEVRKVAQAAAGRWAKVDTYEAVVTRRELTAKGDINAEMLVYQFRKEPMSLFTRNVGEAGKGREVVYNPTKYGDKLHVMLGAGDNRLMGAGFKAPPVSPDDPRVKEKARYSIREAGFGTPIGKVARWAEKAEAGQIPATALMFLGPVNRPEYPHPLTGVALKLRPTDDPMLPGGGLRQWFFDLKADSPAFGMPVVMTATDAKGNEVEYYLFDKVRMPANLTDADFDPARLGKKK